MQVQVKTVSPVRPLNKRVAVKRFDAKSMTESGLIIPESAKETSIGGRVIAVGAGINDIEPQDVVIFGKHAGVEISIEGQNLLMLKYEDILGIFEQ